ncbi:TonB-dependent receptor plug domain-containing protein [Parvularcula lutaonensis]|uniref:TonB-dependent receptor plug domain-containing protein n=1 Tax=Parvularcula lutaonensis TaxID=491923 RepID=A0ABV7MA95_9PROT|nr:outer membrane beta-barrel protein [Parvularcula lutaonensis]GGY36621.1 TonB-dependent receptor [Parvularcula lutaonensis]
MNARKFFAAALPLCLLLTIALAQTEVDGRQVFEPRFFERFAPQTALDMLRRVPGFSVRNNSDGRGLGQGGTNVLINGQRVTAKDTGPLEILGRTPASSVVRIEISDAASLGVTGLTGQVANVVTEQDKLTGNWEWNPQFRHGLPPRLHAGSVSFSGKAGGMAYTVGLESSPFRNGNRGPEYVFGPDGELTETRYEDGQFFGDRPSITVNLSGGKKETLQYNFTGSGVLFEFDGREISQRPDDFVRVNRNSEDEWNAEVSGDLTKTIGPGDAKIIAYHRYEHSPFVNELQAFDTGTLLQTDHFFQTSDETETIARVEYAIPRPKDRSWELAAEYAFNSLDNESAFATDGSGTVVRTDFDDVEVTEDRIQSSVTYSRKIGPKLAFQGSLGSEYSEIQSRTGTVEGEPRSFFRPRGFVSLAYPFGEDMDIRARIERSVGQLNFFAFVSSQNLNDETTQAGNTNLVPQQSWDGELEVERRWAEEEKVVFRTTLSLIEDRVDNIVIDGEEAVGNIDEARQLSLEVEGTTLLDRWGIEGGRVDFRGERNFSEIDDPLTGESRPFSGQLRYFANIGFRQDIPNTDYAYGAEITHLEFENRPQALQTSFQSFSQPQTEIFIQHKDFFGLNVTGYVVNLLDMDERFERTVYDGFRDQSPVLFREARSRDYKAIVGFNVQGTF